MLTAIKDRELATVLAALRLFQEVLQENPDRIQGMDHFQFGHAPLDLNEIDQLCEQINKQVAYDGDTFGVIQGVLQRYYNGEIEDQEAIHEMAKLPPEELAEFILDAFNSGWITPFNMGFND